MAKTFICNPDYPVVETKQGKLRGFLFDDVFGFEGVRYAVAKRFQMPEEVPAWEGIKDAISYGYDCVDSRFPLPRPEENIMLENTFWPQSEHCQYLNVWTPTIDPKAKKAVMVWLHGGGYSFGSAEALTLYRGDALCKKDDVVLVTVNHRLNVFGFLDVSEYGPEYKDSVNVGIEDMVAALKWVRDNIAAFGGDPDNVTIFGQSGGGGKVAALGQCKNADGLFHKAIIMSGSIPDDNILVKRVATPAEILDAIFKELDLDRTADGAFEKFLECPPSILVRAVDRASAALTAAGRPVGWGPQPNDYYTGYVTDGGVSESFSKVPVMIGTCWAEFQMNTGLSKDPEYMKLFKKAYPDVQEKFADNLDYFFREATLRYARKRAADAEAPTYLYIFKPEMSLNGGMMTTHGFELPFAFHHCDITPASNIEGVDLLEAQTSGAWTNFAKYGDPNVDCLPQWDPCTKEDLKCMAFDNKESELLINHEEEIIRYSLTHLPDYKIDFFAPHIEPVKWPY